MMASFEWQLGAHEHEHLGEVDFLLREDGGRQIHSRQRFAVYGVRPAARFAAIHPQ